MFNLLIGYLIFVIAAALLIGLLVLRLKLPAPQIIIPLIMIVIILPVLSGYYYAVYFDSIPDMIVPDLRGMSVTAATEKLRTLDLKGRLAGQIIETEVPLGAVVSQRPEGGRRVKVGRTVNFLISANVQRVPVPNLLGQPESQLEGLLAAKGLQVSVISYEFSPGVDFGIILNQNPLPGEIVAAGTSVEVTVSTPEGGEN